ncbi:hybrid sensor histidine kinase/response regulator [Macromonas nakdongensis]|uniref:hybrid sensor histidine kinase/response regulator n=1 Tax=Macromonas nakdongensis TaxID=1843082 RepID=UPI000C326203|nr:ATP-binding protein [Macromonas nakdongensis]
MSKSPSRPPPREQQIFRYRRAYNTWVADETMEDYALRYAPRSFRKWSEWRVASTAFGSLSFLALEAIGAAIAINYGFTNAMLAIGVVCAIIFATGLPIAYHAARHGLDLDLLTRGAGFGYLGSTITSLIYAGFTFIFFALEAAIMAMALRLATDWHLTVCYVVSALVIIPLTVRGITFISKLQGWTQLPWLFLMCLPFVWLALHEPQVFRELGQLAGLKSGSSGFDWLMFGTACSVIFALVVQIGEQVDYLRFLPPLTPANRGRWWSALLVAGPGWAVVGMLKMVGGALLAFFAMQHEIVPARAAEPAQMYLTTFSEMFGLPGVAVALTLFFVLVSQVKINVTNAYAGSLAWSNFFSRITRSHPGRVVWLVFNVVIATLLMVLDVFAGLEIVLGIYSNVAIAWVGALVADLVINKPLGLSPAGIEFRRAHLYDFNPVGLGAMVLAAVVATVAYSGALGEMAAAFSPFIALGLALLLAPTLAWLTGGHYYSARQPEAQWRRGELLTCAVCENRFESEDMAACPAYAAPICSLCCSLESRCHDRCKHQSRATDQLRHWLGKLVPQQWLSVLHFRVGHFLLVFLLLWGVIGLTFLIVYMQESHRTDVGDLQIGLLKIYALLGLLSAVAAWWVVLTTDSRRIAQDESERQTELLKQEIEAHRHTDAALKQARDQAESASQAKTRYIAGLTHELRSPLTSILGHAQILQKKPDIQGELKATVAGIERSGHHMHALIDESLELARIEAGRMKLDAVPVHLPSLIGDVEHMMKPQAAAKGLRFAVELEGELPTWIKADPKRLRQILINLLTNALRFTDEGQVTLRLDFRQQVARLAVVDTGIGIAPTDQQRIFLPYERGAAGRRNPQTGTGLGLTITHLLVSMMGGELTLQSAPGAGTTFTVRLYLPTLGQAQLPVPAGPDLLLPIKGYRPPVRTLLVVDDQPFHRQLVAGLLSPLGFVVREAASGEECLEAVAAQRPDAILLDLSMDTMDGWQTLAHLRVNYPPQLLPVVIVSANTFDNQPERLERLQAQGFVAKPVAESELLRLLTQVLHLQWIHDHPAPPVPAEPADRWDWSRREIDPELREALTHMARRGEIHGLRRQLAEAQARFPDLARLWEQLSVAVNRFDFQTVMSILNTVQPPADHE